jgi:enoyl-CoA hydratase/carnithine racemase
METLNIADDGPVRVVEMDRPEALNAFSTQLMDELTDAFLDTAADSALKVLVLTGAGRAFSAGADLMEMGRARSEAPRHGFPGLLEAILEFPKPFFVAVNGVGAGIGATICGLADFAYMAESARLRCPFSALGVTAEAGSTYLLPRLMGRQRASWFLLSAEWMSAQDCLDADLVMEVLAADQLMPRVMEQASKLGALPLSSLTTTKKLIMDPLKTQLRASFEAENGALAALVGSPANREAVAAFREKRDPDFSGL